MIVHKMTVDGNEYFLDPASSVDETKSEVIDAVKSGGGLVEIHTASHSTVSVLVSQRIPVSFETWDFETPDSSEEPDAGGELWDWEFLQS